MSKLRDKGQIVTSCMDQICSLEALEKVQSFFTFRRTQNLGVTVRLCFKRNLCMSSY